MASLLTLAFFGILACVFPAGAYKMCYMMGPTYRTIDGKYWSFNQGQCAPLIAKPCNRTQMEKAGGPKDFELSIDSYFTYDEYYGYSTFGSYGEQYTVRNLLLVALGQKILIGWDQVKVNGKVVTLPWYYPSKAKPDIWITGSNNAVASRWNRKILGSSFGLGIVISGCPYAFFRGVIVTGLTNNMCGMCGTWNNNRNDDFTLPDGTITTSGGEMIEQWTGGKGKQAAKCRQDLKVKKCPPGQIKQAEKICKVLLERDGPLESCYSKFSTGSWYANFVKMHYDRCVELACQNQGKELKETACSKINEMNNLCYMYNGRKAIPPIDECVPKCKPNSKASCVKLACRNSCEDPSASKSLACRYSSWLPCVADCECNDGYTYSGKRDACVKRC